MGECSDLEDIVNHEGDELEEKPIQFESIFIQKQFEEDVKKEMVLDDVQWCNEDSTRCEVKYEADDFFYTVEMPKDTAENEIKIEEVSVCKREPISHIHSSGVVEIADESEEDADNSEAMIKYELDMQQEENAQLDRELKEQLSEFTKDMQQSCNDRMSGQSKKCLKQQTIKAKRLSLEASSSNVENGQTQTQETGSKRTLKDSLFSCVHCDYSSNHKHNFIRHMSVHDEKKTILCPNCDYSTSSKWNLNSHMLAHCNETEKLFSCAVCKFSTNYKHHLIRHRSEHHEKDKRLLSCANCDYSTNCRRSLVRHMLIHKNETAEGYSCNVCDFKTYRNIYLQRHILRKHTEDYQKFHCTICKKPFKSKKSRDDHIIKLHRNFHPFAHRCTSCNFKSTSKFDMTRHIISQHPKANPHYYQCSSCQYVTFNKGVYNRHMNTHRGTKDFVCTCCLKEFSRKFELDSHIVANHRDNQQLMSKVTHKIHICSQCDYKTVIATSFKLHLKRIHL